ncbi:hypothetical protein LDENG_00245870 [Lucifuga dentata]|nr:hypothetical protein LDENG_00245870 [Lucifuga dentata]
MEASSGPDYCPLVQLWLNISSDPSNSTDSMSPTNIFLAVLHGLVSLIGILENVLILGVVGFYIPSSIISTWIINLSLSNLLTTITLPFFTVYMAYNQSWAMSSMLCRLLSSVFFLHMFVNGFLLSAISLDRCLIVVKPIWARNQRNIQAVRKICVLIWVFALIFTIPFYLFRDTLSQQNGKIWCYNNYAQFLPAGHFVLSSLCKTRQQSLAMLKLFVAFLIPLMIIIISYATMSVRLKRRGWRRPFRFVRLVVALVGDIGSAVPISVTLAFLNSILNPILYVFSCPDVCKKITKPLDAMKEVLAEDLIEVARRRSMHYYSKNRERTSPSTMTLNTEEEPEQGPTQN